MAVSEALMKPGAWDLRLADHTPKTVRDALVEKGYLIVTPAWFDVRGVSDASILAIARYAGIVQESSSFSLSGDGLAALLGDGDGLGPVIGLINPGTDTMSTWINAILGATVSNGITAGTLTDAGAANMASQTMDLLTQRAAIDYVCARTGTEWRVNPNGTLDAGVAGSLFTRYTTPNTIVLRHEGGHDYNISGLTVDLLSETKNARQWNSQVLLMGEGEGGSILQEIATIGVNPYFGFTGGALNLARLVDSPSTEPGNAATLAQASLNLYSTARREISLSTSTYDVGRYVKPGDTIYVHDPDRGLTDTANKVQYRGAVLTPKQMRVHGYRWPIQEGMGVFYRSMATGSAVYTDLTPYFERESGSTSYDVGAPTLPVDPDIIIPSSMHGPKTNHAILERRSRGKWRSYTPTWSANAGTPTIGNGSLTGSWRPGSEVFFRITLTIGSTSTFGTGGNAWSFTLPDTNGAFKHAAIALIFDASSGATFPINFEIRGGATTVFPGWSAAGAAAGNGTPVTPGTGDVWDISGWFVPA